MLENGLQLWLDRLSHTFEGSHCLQNYVQTVEYLTYQLIDGYKSGDQNVTAFFEAYDFYIVPFHNPDG